MATIKPREGIHLFASASPHSCDGAPSVDGGIMRLKPGQGMISAACGRVHIGGRFGVLWIFAVRNFRKSTPG